MRYLFILIGLLFMSTDFYGQVLDTAKIRVWYDVSYKQRDDEKALTLNKEILDIGDKYSCYFNYEAEYYAAYIDSIKKANPDIEDYSSITSDDNTPKNGRGFRIYKSLLSDSLIYTDKLFSFGFQYSQRAFDQKWKLEDGDTTICNMHCNKASLELHGRKWIAWYTLEIPISDGPWKLCGLPGLIVQAEEESGIFSFRLDGIEKKAFPICFKERKYTKTTPEKFQKEAIDFWHNQLEYILVHQNIPHSPEISSHEESFTPCLMEKF